MLNCNCFWSYRDNSPPGQFPTIQVFGPDIWFYLFVVVLVGSCPRENGPGGQKLGFIFILWGLVPSGELS